MVRIGRYIRISNREQRKGLERQLFQMERLVERLGGELENSPLYVDVKSGRDPDRQEFKRFCKDIESKAVDIVVAYRVDRLARDAQVSLRLADLFESAGVRLYDFQGDRFIDFANPEDWEGYAQRGVSADAESRKLSSRIRAGYEYSRHKGKAGSKPAWGYIRNPETEKYELDPALADAVRDSVKIVLASGNFQRSCRQIARKWGKQWQSNSLRKWISNPCLRGHTGYGHEGRRWREVRYNTHPEHAVLTEEQYQWIENLIQERRLYWGKNRKAERHSLGGLAYCGRCGTKMVITAGGQPDDEVPIFYFTCRQRAQRIVPGEPCGMKRSLSLSVLEDYTIQQLTAAAGQIATIAQATIVLPKSDRLLELEALLNGLNKLGSSSMLEASKAQIRAEIAALTTQSSEITAEVGENRELLVSIFSDPLTWQTLSKAEKSAIFRGLIDRILISMEEVPTGEMSRRGNPKMRIDWTVEFHLKVGLQDSPSTVRFSSFPRNN
ncbi:recombinase family protein [Phormidium tenue FACHB-886]|nr:recombinase family protein [Phormidium tenue FACHB-886]